MKLTILFAWLTLVAFAQVRSATYADSPSTNLPAHRIGPNDLLSLSVYAAPELSKLVRVSTEGFIRLPMVKPLIKVEGSLPSEVETKIAEALEAENILVEPFVTVTVAEYSSRPINVAGAVRKPHTFQAVGPIRLLNAITEAGGLTEQAGLEILVSEGDKPIQRIPVKALLEGSEPALNIPLNGGEDIRVMEAGKAFVVGNVKRPGVYPLRDSKDCTVLQMLALAEGLTPFSSKQAYIYRRAADGTRTEMTIELDRILRRKHEDVAIMADDIFYIPENKGRKLGAAALERALLFGGAASTALIYSSR